ncbi:MAG: hypothetical protein JXA79_08955 [Deltaproteobacteria bacterium]|nr:hypothetical protein [Deltaproteobacteria bacterium]
MAFALNPIYLANFIMAVIIAVFGVLGYNKTGDKGFLYIGIAFILFAISHTTMLFELITLEVFLITIRITGYVLIAIAVYSLAFKRR